jgi:hypothetical protein
LRLFIFTTVAVFFTAMSSARAAESGSQFGLLYGLSIPDAYNSNPRKMFGVKGEALLMPSFSLGGYYVNSSSKDLGTGGVPFRYSIGGIEASYHLLGGSGDTYFGARFGISKVRTLVTGTDIIFSPYHYGLVCGYDYLLTGWLAAGFEGSFMYVEKGHTILNSTSYNLDAFSILQFLVSIQIHL